MRTADGMRNVTENIMVSHQVRTEALGDLVKGVSQSLADTRSMMKSNAVAREAMGKEQAAELARFVGDLAGLVGAKLKEFQKELERVANERVRRGRQLKGRLHKETNKMLADFHKGHAEMSVAMRSRLRGCVKDIVRAVGDMTASTQGMMRGYRADIRAAADIWNQMTRTLATSGGKEESGPVRKAVCRAQKIRTKKE